MLVSWGPLVIAPPLASSLLAPFRCAGASVLAWGSQHVSGPWCHQSFQKSRSDGKRLFVMVITAAEAVARHIGRCLQRLAREKSNAADRRASRRSKTVVTRCL